MIKYINSHSCDCNFLNSRYSNLLLRIHSPSIASCRNQIEIETLSMYFLYLMHVFVKRDAVLCIFLFFCRWSWSSICISKGQFITWKIQRIISYMEAFSGTPRIPQIDCTWILDKILEENKEQTQVILVFHMHLQRTVHYMKNPEDNILHISLFRNTWGILDKILEENKEQTQVILIFHMHLQRTVHYMKNPEDNILHISLFRNTSDSPNRLYMNSWQDIGRKQRTNAAPERRDSENAMSMEDG